MKLPVPQTSGVGTTGATGIALMILHITGYLTGWAWPLLCTYSLLSQASDRRIEKNDHTRND